MPDYRTALQRETARMYQLNFNRASRNIVNEYLKSNYTGTWIAASDRVYLEHQSDIPILVMSKLDALRLWQVDFKFNAVVVVTELATGRLYQHRLYSRSSGETFAGPPFASRLKLLPAAETSGYFIQENRFFDLNHVCRFQACNGEYAVSIIYFDQVSNVERLTVTGALEPLRLTKVVNVRPVKENHPRVSHPLQLSVKSQCSSVVAKCSINLPKANHRKVLVGHLLMTTLDRGITARKELCIPVSSTGSRVYAEFEVDLGKIFTRRLQNDNRLYLAMNGELSEPVPLNLSVIKSSRELP